MRKVNSMVNIIALKCPKCGADLQIEQGRNQCFCSYCGAKILLQNENEYVYRTVDEAKIREKELQAEMYNKEMEARERKCEMSRNFFKKRLIIYVILAVIGYAGGFGLMKINSGVSAAFLGPGVIGMACLFYGSIIHGIILLVNSKK
jgi:DNA-directed RNA polymerase subunit RPC12/RpoP